MGYFKNRTDKQNAERDTKKVVKGVIPKIADELKFTSKLVETLRQEIDRMTEQNKLLYDEVKLTNEKLKKIEKYFTEK